MSNYKTSSKLVAVKDLFLDETDRKLFTKGRVYILDLASNYYVDWTIKDDYGYVHEVDKELLDKYFKLYL